MLSVITSAGEPSGELAGLLSDLVPAAITGLVRDVLVLEPATEDRDLFALCEAAGARRIRGGLGVAVQEARSDLILLATPRLRLDAFALDRLGRELAAGEGLHRGLALTAPAPPGLGFLSPPLGLVTSRARLAAVPAGVSPQAALSRASRGAVRLRVAG